MESYVEIVKEKMMEEGLSPKPEKYSLYDSPLHLAVAEGHVDIVKELLRVNGEETCSVRNLDGMTALHVAAIKGQALVLRELVRIRPELLQVPTNQGETALHLSVMWNRVEALKVLVEEISNLNEFGEMLNSKDCEGNTLLHIAVSKNHLEIVNYLVTVNGFQVNALNKNELTALDILLTQSPPPDMEIEHALRNAGASSVKDLHLITHDWFLGKVTKTPISLSQQRAAEASDKRTYWLHGTKLIALVVAASLAAFAGFKAGQFLRGSWQKDFTVEENGHLEKNPYYQAISQMSFFYGDRILSSLLYILKLTIMLGGFSGLLLGLSWLTENRKWWTCLQVLIMLIAISVQVAMYLLVFRDVDTGQAI